jgi:sphingolipid 8-(E)-desaturase
MSTEDLGPRESFIHRQLRTTTDIACPPWLEFFHGGLQLQVPHHLFPRLPRHNLREVSFMVKEWAKERGLEYAEFRGFIHGNSVVQGLLKDVAEQLQVMGMVVESEVREAITTTQPHTHKG